MNATLIANRVAKARRFIDFLDAHLPADTDLDLVEIFTAGEWAEIAQLAGEQPPSTETRAAILVGLRERRSTESPLRGLPR